MMINDQTGEIVDDFCPCGDGTCIDCRARNATLNGEPPRRLTDPYFNSCSLPHDSQCGCWDCEEAREDAKEARLVIQGTSSGSGNVFPFTLADLKYWVVKRKDGTIIKHVLEDKFDAPAKPAGYLNATNGSGAFSTHKSLGAWCSHYPKKLPVFEQEGIMLYIADASGARRDKAYFDVLLDCGQVINWGVLNRTLEGDARMVEELSKYSQTIENRLLKVDWYDRKAPALGVEFWPALTNLLKSFVAETGLKQRVLCICQGGHGRSGTSLVNLMMCLNEEYSPLDAITHLRAIHCPRAIESKEQHEYIDQLGVHLGREKNAAQAGEIASYKDAFLALKLESAEPYQKLLSEGAWVKEMK